MHFLDFVLDLVFLVLAITAVICFTGTPCPKKNTRPRSLSPSPPPSRYLHPSAFEDALQRDARGQMGQMRRQFQKEQDYRRRKAKVTILVL